jgi:hypothetical protein
VTATPSVRPSTSASAVSGYLAPPAGLRWLADCVRVMEQSTAGTPRFNLVAPSSSGRLAAGTRPRGCCSSRRSYLGQGVSDADLPGVLGWRLRSRSTAFLARTGLRHAGCPSGTAVQRGRADVPGRPHGFTRCRLGRHWMTSYPVLGLDLRSRLRSVVIARPCSWSRPVEEALSGRPRVGCAAPARPRHAASAVSLVAGGALTCGFGGGGEGI